MTESPYLAEGEQTKLTPIVYEHAERAKHTKIGKAAALPKPLPSIYRTCKYIHQLPLVKGYNPNPQTDKENAANLKLKDNIFRKRNLNQILEEGLFPCCSDIGLLFRGLMIAQGIPTVYVEAFHEEYIFNGSLKGHVFGRVFDGIKSVIVDPGKNPKIYDSEAKIFPYIIFREGLDSWDIGIYCLKDLARIRESTVYLETLLNRYETNLKKQSEKLISQKIEQVWELREKIRNQNANSPKQQPSKPAQS